MSPIVHCLNQPYDCRLMLLALAVCLTASVATFSLYPRAISEVHSANAPLWIALTTVTAGAAIWATNFTAMLAFAPGLSIGFEIATTAASFIVAMLLTGAAFVWAVCVGTRLGLITAGILLGMATAATHFTGLSGMQIAGVLVWSLPLSLLSIVLGSALSLATLVAAGKGTTRLQRLTGACLFTLSIATFHFVGMAAVTVVPDATKVLPRNLLFGDLLAATVGLVTLLIVGSAASAWLIDRRARRESELRVRFMARHDLLTSLPNRFMFEELVGNRLAENKTVGRLGAMLFLDLDGFKEVNDIFGHPAGDALLVEVARRLRDVLGARCVAARLGGDEFAVFAADLDDAGGAAVAAQNLLDALCAPYAVEGSLLDIGCSVGVSMFPADGETYERLLARADIALSRAKADGRGVFRYFEPIMDEVLRARRRLGRDLRAALNTDQLHLAFQPQYDLDTEEVSGFEALARWTHPSSGAIAPATFIPVAEETGIILPLGEWVLREACRVAAGWRNPLTVAVNLSVAQFRQTALLEMIAAILEDTGLPAHRLELEMTESLFFEIVPRTLQVLERLKEMGVRVSIDDFGTGFSSLATLQSFAFDKIKIDHTFTNQIGRTTKGTAIVKAVIELGDALGMTVIAEGVETAEQVEFLRGQRCREVQGHLYGRPLPISRYRHLVHGHELEAKHVA